MLPEPPTSEKYVDDGSAKQGEGWATWRRRERPRDGELDELHGGDVGVAGATSSACSATSRSSVGASRRSSLNVTEKIVDHQLHRLGRTVRRLRVVAGASERRSAATTALERVPTRMWRLQHAADAHRTAFLRGRPRVEQAPWRHLHGRAPNDHARPPRCERRENRVGGCLLVVETASGPPAEAFARHGRRPTSPGAKARSRSGRGRGRRASRAVRSSEPVSFGFG